jgi:hypothetical protein
MGDDAQGIVMAQNVRDNFAVLAAAAEINALGETHPLMRQIMLRLSAAYRELDAQDLVAGMPAMTGAQVIPFRQRARRRGWVACPNSAA